MKRGVDEEAAPVKDDRVRPVVICHEEGARQSDAGACDLNTLMAQYDKSGVVPYTTAEAMYADVSEIGDFRAALDRVMRGEEAFMSLPVKTRVRFNHDPAEFLEFMADEKNLKEAVELGLVKPLPAVPVAAAVAAVPSASS